MALTLHSDSQCHLLTSLRSSSLGRLPPSLHARDPSRTNPRESGQCTTRLPTRPAKRHTSYLAFEECLSTTVTHTHPEPSAFGLAAEAGGYSRGDAARLAELGLGEGVELR